MRAEKYLYPRGDKKNAMIPQLLSLADHYTRAKKIKTERRQKNFISKGVTQKGRRTFKAIVYTLNKPSKD